MKFIDIELAGRTFRAQLMENQSPSTTRAIWDTLPFDGRAVHGRWSGAIFRMLEEAPLETELSDRGAGFQYPGLVVLNPNNKELAICYGQGRLNHPTGPLNPIPIAEIGGDLTPLVEFGNSLQFDGARPIKFEKSIDQNSELAAPPPINGRQIAVDFDGVVTTATLLENVSPTTASSFAELLPLTGRASNTHSSGTLVRFWNSEGGPEGETVLQHADTDPSQAVLYPRYLYYLPNPPWRGIRIPYEATAMGGATSRGTTRLIPIARFDNDWSGFREQAKRLLIDGAKSLSIRHA